MTQIKRRAPAKTPRPSARLAAARARAEAVFERLSQAAPAPKTELEYSNVYTLLVAVALSASWVRTASCWAVISLRTGGATYFMMIHTITAKPTSCPIKVDI